MMKWIHTALAVSGSMLMLSCGHDTTKPNLEYAPQMYHAIAFEPFSQVLDTTSEYYNTINVNSGGQNMRKPAPGSIARKQYAGMKKGSLAKDIFQYNIPADSLEYAAKVLVNPIPLSPQAVEEGKVLYGRYCQACHGAGGTGDGKVADQYTGVANLVVKSKIVTEGHIFHVITHGKGRMWPHGSQVNPDERWKIVHFVKSLGNTPPTP